MMVHTNVMCLSMLCSLHQRGYPYSWKCVLKSRSLDYYTSTCTVSHAVLLMSEREFPCECCQPVLSCRPLFLTICHYLREKETKGEREGDDISIYNPHAELQDK